MVRIDIRNNLKNPEGSTIAAIRKIMIMTEPAAKRMTMMTRMPKDRKMDPRTLMHHNPITPRENRITTTLMRDLSMAIKIVSHQDLKIHTKKSLSTKTPIMAGRVVQPRIISSALRRKIDP